jgi:chromate transporter
MTTPAIIAVALLRFLGRRAEHPRATGAIQGVVLASAGLLWTDALPLGRQAVSDPLLLAILVLGVGVLATRKVESLWVIFGSAIIYLAAASVGVVAGLW